MKQRSASTYRAAKRNAERKPKHIKPVDILAGITPRPKKVKKHVVPSRKEEARRTSAYYKRADGKPAHAPEYVSHAGYNSKQAERAKINKITKAGTTPKSRRKARKDRKEHHRKVQKGNVAGKKTAVRRSS